MSDQGTNQSIPEPDNVGDDVRAAIDELKVGSTEPQIDVVIDKGESGRQRDEAGRFAAALKDKPEDKPRDTLSLPEKKTDGVQADPTAALGVPKPADVAVPQPTPTEPPKPVIEPPKGWNADAKAKWAELPEVIQREAVRREEALTKQLFAHDESRDFGRKLQDIANPYMPIIMQEGADIPKAFQNYLQTSYTLRNGTPHQKSEALHRIAQTFNVDLNLAHQQGAASPELAELRQQVLDLKRAQQGQDQERQQREDQSLQQTIAEFSTAPGHEHFDRVRTRMGALLDSGEAKDMEDAYQQAIWAHPDIRSTLIEAQSKAAEEKRQADQKAKAEAAKSAAVSVKGSPGGSRPLNGATSHGSIADDLRAAMAEVRGRV